MKTALNANSREHCFELFGYDFLVDEDMRVWLLEVNTNPYLGAQNSWHEALLPAMVDDMLKLVTDPVFPPPPGVAHGGVGFQHEKQVASKAPDENWCVTPAGWLAGWLGRCGCVGVSKVLTVWLSRRVQV